MLKEKLNYRSINIGDKVGIFIPSSPIKNSFRLKGLDWLYKTGLIPVETNDILNKNAFVAKEPLETLNDLKDFLENDEIRVLWAARGGYGSNYIMPYLRKFIDKVRISGPKIIIGSSDVSYLLWGLLDVPEITLLYGPMIYSSIPEGNFMESQLTEMLFNPPKELNITGNVLIEGKCNGVLTGGCLSNFVSLIGTPFLPDTKNKILLLEDINERPYRLDRMFWQLKNSGILPSVSGLVLGEFPGCFNSNNEKNDFYIKLKKSFQSFNIPVIIDLPLGHSEKMYAIELGVNISIDTKLL